MATSQNAPARMAKVEPRALGLSMIFLNPSTFAAGKAGGSHPPILALCPGNWLSAEVRIILEPYARKNIREPEGRQARQFHGGDRGRNNLRGHDPPRSGGVRGTAEGIRTARLPQGPGAHGNDPNQGGPHERAGGCRGGGALRGLPRYRRGGRPAHGRQSRHYPYQDRSGQPLGLQDQGGPPAGSEIAQLQEDRQGDHGQPRSGGSERRGAQGASEPA